MIINIHAAKTQLSTLIEKAEAGEEVIITRAGKPVARLSALGGVSRSDSGAPGDLPAWVGSLRGQIWIAPDIEATEAEIAREMLEGAIFPVEAPER